MQGSTAYILAAQGAEELVASALSGIVSHSVDNVNKTITFTFADNTSATLTFSQPSDGNGITSTTLDSNYHFIITYDNGNTEDAGAVPYQTAARIDTSTNHLILELTDGTEIDAGELPTGTMDTSKYLAKDNTTAFTPVGDYNPATKKYVDDIIGDITSLNVTGVNDLVGALNKLDASFMASMAYASKKLTITYKNGSTYDIDLSSIITDTNIEELSNVVVSNIQNGDVLVYDAASNKFVNKQVSASDEKVKMASGDATGDYLENLLDGTTVVNDNGKLVAKTLDGQTITIAELNALKGIKGNVQATLDLISSGNLKVINTPFSTYADLSSFDFSTLTDGMSYIAYVLVDETRDSAKTSYIVDKKGDINFFGVTTISTRDFSTDPVDLTSEVTGKLPKENIAVDDVLGELTTSKEYKTLTSKEEVFNTHGANEMYNEIITGLGKKVNTSDVVDNLTSESTDKPLSAKQGKELNKQVDDVNTALTTHTDNADIHVTKTDKEKWDKVDDKVDKTAILSSMSNDPTDENILSELAIKGLLDSKADLSKIKVVDVASISTSLNDFKTDDGTTFVGRGTFWNNTTTDGPIGPTGAYTVVWFPYSVTGLYGIQILKTVQASGGRYRMFSRSIDNGNWSGWKQMLDEDDITATINENSTDKQIPSAKAVYDANIHRYYDFGGDFTFSDIGINSTMTITECVRGIANYIISTYGASRYIQIDFCTNNNSSVFNKSMPTNGQSVLGYIRYMPWQHINRIEIMITNLVEGGTYIGTLNNSNTGDIVWKRVCSTSVSDVNNTTITGTSSKYEISNSYYSIKNGVCYYMINVIPREISLSWEACCDMPKASIPSTGGTPPHTDQTLETFCGLQYKISSDGKLYIAYGSVGAIYCISGSYPVLE